MELLRIKTRLLVVLKHFMEENIFVFSDKMLDILVKQFPEPDDKMFLNIAIRYNLNQLFFLSNTKNGIEISIQNIFLFLEKYDNDKVLRALIYAFDISGLLMESVDVVETSYKTVHIDPFANPFVDC